MKIVKLLYFLMAILLASQLMFSRFYYDTFWFVYPFIMVLTFLFFLSFLVLIYWKNKEMKLEFFALGVLSLVFLYKTNLFKAKKIAEISISDDMFYAELKFREGGNYEIDSSAGWMIEVESGNYLITNDSILLFSSGEFCNYFYGLEIKFNKYGLKKIYCENNLSEVN